MDVLLIVGISIVGVCKDCWLDGFGRHGAYGGFVGSQIKPAEARRKLATEKWDKEKLEKYGKMPKYWLDAGFNKNPEYQKWNLRRIKIDDDEKRRENAVFVESKSMIADNKEVN